MNRLPKTNQPTSLRLCQSILNPQRLKRVLKQVHKDQLATIAKAEKITKAEKRKQVKRRPAKARVRI